MFPPELRLIRKNRRNRLSKLIPYFLLVFFMGHFQKIPDSLRVHRVYI